MVNIGAIFGRGGNKSEEHHETVERNVSHESSTKVTEENVKQVEIPKKDLERVADFAHKEDDVFARAKTATRKAEEAAAFASAEAEKAVKLVSEAEISRKEVETIEKHHEEIRHKIEDTKIADVEAKAKKDELADVREAIKTKGDIFDNARNQARGVANDVKGKSSSLDKEKETLGNLEGDLDKAEKLADHLRQHLKELEAKKPEHDTAVREAVKIVETSGQDIGKLQKELSDAENEAADLERRAREARQKAHKKKEELDNAQKRKVTVVGDHDKKKGLASDLEKQIADLKNKVANQEKSIKDLADKTSGKKSAIEQLTSELNKLQQAAKQTDADAREKRKDYDAVESRLEPLQKAAADAAAAQKQALQTRQELTKEFDSYARRLEKSQVVLAESTEAAKLALEAAKRSDAKKHELLETAEKANKEADELTHKKIETVEDVLSDKLGALTHVSKEVMEQTETKQTETSKTSRKAVNVDEEGPATPDLTQQASQQANEAKTAQARSQDNNGQQKAGAAVQDQISKVKHEASKATSSVKHAAQK